MKEKERYELLNDNFIYDNKLKEYVSSPNSSMKHYMETLTELLNQQNKQIKQLNEQLEYYKKEMLRDGETFTMSQAKVFDEITQENQQLKQQLLEYQEQSIRDNQNWVAETTKLQQQLHDLPKKIVEEIKAYYTTPIYDSPYADTKVGVLLDRLDTILKKYGGEDD